MTNAVTSDIDLFNDSILSDPYPSYSTLRSIGPVVYLPRCQAYALTNYRSVRQALRDSETFSSAQGVSLNSELNEYQQGSLLGSDAPRHTHLRKLISGAFSPMALGKMRPELETRAEQLVVELATQRRFDAIKDLAAVFPFEAACDLIGLPKVNPHRLRQFSDSHFDACGPLGPQIERNARVARAWEEHQTASAYVAFMAKRLKAGGVGAALFTAAECGDITQEDASSLLSSLMGAGMDTTARALGTAIFCFAENPDQWDRLRSDPALIPAAFNEVLRYDSSSQMLARCTTRPCEVSGVSLPANARVLLLFASANRDEDAFPHADRFDISRQPAPGHLSFGGGVHTCVGQALARAQAHVLIAALARRVSRIHLLAPPERRINSVLRGYSRMLVQVEAEAEAARSPMPVSTQLAAI